MYFLSHPTSPKDERRCWSPLFSLFTSKLLCIYFSNRLKSRPAFGNRGGIFVSLLVGFSFPFLCSVLLLMFICPGSQAQFLFISIKLNSLDIGVWKPKAGKGIKDKCVLCSLADKWTSNSALNHHRYTSHAFHSRSILDQSKSRGRSSKKKR